MTGLNFTLNTVGSCGIGNRNPGQANVSWSGSTLTATGATTVEVLKNWTITDGGRSGNSTAIKVQNGAKILFDSGTAPDTGGGVNFTNSSSSLTVTGSTSSTTIMELAGANTLVIPTINATVESTIQVDATASVTATSAFTVDDSTINPAYNSGFGTLTLSASTTLTCQNDSYVYFHVGSSANSPPTHSTISGGDTIFTNTVFDVTSDSTSYNPNAMFNIVAGTSVDWDGTDSITYHNFTWSSRVVSGAQLQLHD